MVPDILYHYYIARLPAPLYQVHKFHIPPDVLIYSYPLFLVPPNLYRTLKSIVVYSFLATTYIFSIASHYSIHSVTTIISFFPYEMIYFPFTHLKFAYNYHIIQKKCTISTDLVIFQFYPSIIKHKLKYTKSQCLCKRHIHSFF